MSNIRNGLAYSKKIDEKGNVSEYYHEFILTEKSRDIYAIYYTFSSPTTKAAGTVINDLTKNTLTFNYRKIEGPLSQVTGVLYYIGNNYYRGTRFFQEPSATTTFFQVKILE